MRLSRHLSKVNTTWKTLKFHGYLGARETANTKRQWKCYKKPSDHLRWLGDNEVAKCIK